MMKQTTNRDEKKDYTQYEQLIHQQIAHLTYEEIQSELSRNIKRIERGWDMILQRDGEFYRYDYERKHRSREAYEDTPLTHDETLQYLALEKVKKDLKNGIIVPISKSIIMDLSLLRKEEKDKA